MRINFWKVPKLSKSFTAKKLHESKLIDFYDTTLIIHKATDKFNELGVDTIKNKVDLEEFEKYILDYFYDSIKTNEN